jgi:urease accessory protein
MAQARFRFEGSMLRATSIVRRPAVKAERVVDTVTLDHEARRGRRGILTGEGGLGFQLELDTDATLNDGDALKLEDGRLVQVRAAPQRLLEVRAENPARLLKLAVQIGARHAAAEITAQAIYLEEDPALAELARGQGCIATVVMRPFQPERGLAEHDCGHDHGHHGHAHHGHGHDHAHGGAHDHHPTPSREHGHGHSHEHDHEHAHVHDHEGSGEHARDRHAHPHGHEH